MRSRCPRALAALAAPMWLPLTACAAAAATSPAGADSSYRFTLPDSLPLFRTYDRRYIREDTLAVPFTYIYKDDVESEATRVSLEEILRRCIEAEENQYEGVEDISFRMSEKVVLFYGDPLDSLTKRTIMEEVTRVYRKKPDRLHTVTLSRRKYTLRKKNGKMTVTGEESSAELDASTTREELTDLPFFFEDLTDYDFEIAERVDLADRVLYRIGFTPRSDFDPLPTGEFWIDTADFRIFNTSLRFTENVPVPLILQGVDHAAIEMKRFGGLWVHDRVTARIRLRKLPFVPIPRVVDVVVTFDEYAIDQGLEDAIFGEGGS